MLVGEKTLRCLGDFYIKDFNQVQRDAPHVALLLHHYGHEMFWTVTLKLARAIRIVRLPIAESHFKTFVVTVVVLAQ